MRDDEVLSAQEMQPTANPAHQGATVLSNDTHAAVGRQVTRINSKATGALNTLVSLSSSGRIDLVAHAPDGLRVQGWNYNRNAQSFTPDDG